MRAVGVPAPGEAASMAAIHCAGSSSSSSSCPSAAMAGRAASSSSAAGSSGGAASSASRPVSEAPQAQRSCGRMYSRSRRLAPHRPPGRGSAMRSAHRIHHGSLMLRGSSSSAPPREILLCTRPPSSEELPSHAAVAEEEEEEEQLSEEEGGFVVEEPSAQEESSSYAFDFTTTLMDDAIEEHVAGFDIEFLKDGDVDEAVEEEQESEEEQAQEDFFAALKELEASRARSREMTEQKRARQSAAHEVGRIIDDVVDVLSRNKVLAVSAPPSESLRLSRLLEQESSAMQQAEETERTLQAAWLRKSEATVAEETLAIEDALMEAGFFDDTPFVDTDAQFMLEPATPGKVASKWRCVAADDFEWQPSPAETGFAAQLVAQQEADLMDPRKLLADMQLARHDAALEIDAILSNVVEQRVDAAMQVQRQQAAAASRQQALRKAAASQRAASEVEGLLTDALASFCKQKANHEFAQHREMQQCELGNLWSHWYEEVDSEEERFRAQLQDRRSNKAAVVEEAQRAEAPAMIAAAPEEEAVPPPAMPSTTPVTPAKSKRRVFGRQTRGHAGAELDLHGSSLLKAEKPAACFRMDVGEGARRAQAQDRDSSLTRGYESLGAAQIFSLRDEEAPVSRSRAVVLEAPRVLPPVKTLRQSASESALSLDLGPQSSPAMPPPPGALQLNRASSLGAIRFDVAKSPPTGFSFSGKGRTNATYSLKGDAGRGPLGARALPGVDPLGRRHCVDFALF
eukprot:TRINITY_DN102159_c0_g1_i1.p1 TRINITY_DN102159_c0_g1~~TRINITY_DN102159_c0_g1_i1.p1  ORF type:complete len:742 (-),score=221.34 TRINITY_DN102159_c0_g1_i1:353-2578(-)